MRIFKWMVLNKKKLDKELDDLIDIEVKDRLRAKVFYFIWYSFPFFLIAGALYCLIKKFK